MFDALVDTLKALFSSYKSFLTSFPRAQIAGIDPFSALMMASI